MFIDDTKLIQVNNGADLAIDAVTLSGPVGDLILQGPSGHVNIPSVISLAGGGAFSGTWTGAPTLTWTPTWSGHQNFSAGADVAGGALTGTFTGNRTFSGSSTYTGSLISTATHGTVARAHQDRVEDSINILEMGVGGASVDRTGAADASGAIQAAINLAVSVSPPKSVYFPSGTYRIDTRLLLVSGTSGLTLKGEPGATVLLLGPANSSNAAILGTQARVDYLTLDGLIFDGNAANNTTNTNPLVSISSPSIGFVSHRCEYRNCNGTGLALIGEQPLAGNLSVQANSGQPVLTFSALPAGVKPGAYVVSSAFVDPDMYVISTTSTTATLNRNLTDTGVSGSSVNFSKAFTSNADVLYGATVIPTSDTSGLSVGQTIYAQGLYFPTTTRITAITTNTSVTVDHAIQSKMPSGTNIAAMGGHGNVRVERSRFKDIGQINLTGGTRSYTTVGSQTNGSSTLTLQCRSGAGATQAGLVPGQTVGASPPAGIAAGVMITDGPTINTGANTFTVTLSAPLTGTIADATSIPFNVSLGGLGYGVWHGWGAPFSQVNAKYIANHFEHTWSACLWGVGTMNGLFEGNHYIQDGMQFRDPVTAPSPCLNLEASIGARVVGDVGSGATGAGIEAEHPVDLTIVGGKFTRNLGAGIVINGGHDVIIGGGVILSNNGQYVNFPYTQNLETIWKATCGLSLSGSATTSLAGTASNFVIGTVICSDTQNTPTQHYGLRLGTNPTATFTNLVVNGVTGTGNSVALVDSDIMARTDNSWQTGQRKLYLTGASVGNGADTTEDLLQSFTIPANTLGAVGDTIHVVAGGSFAASTDSKTANIRFGGISGNLLGTCTGSAAGTVSWYLEAWITKTGTTAQSFSTVGTVINATTGGTKSGTTVLDETNTIQLVVTGKNATNSVANSVTCQFMFVELLK